MKAITIRKIPPLVARELEKLATEERLSLNKAAILLMERGAGGMGGDERRAYDDLDHLFGTWSKEEADQFDKALAEQRKIDPELWK